MRTYRLYFSNGKNTLIKAVDRQSAWDVAKWHEDPHGKRCPFEAPYYVLYIQFFHT